MIVYSAVASRQETKLSSALLSLLAIWGISTLLASPLFFGMQLTIYDLPAHIAQAAGTDQIAYCSEAWGSWAGEYGRLCYTIFSLLVQFLLPLTLISMAHGAIKRKLQNLPSWKKTSVAEHPTTSSPPRTTTTTITGRYSQHLLIRVSYYLTSYSVKASRGIEKFCNFLDKSLT